MARQVYLNINTRPREVLRVMDQVIDDVRRHQTGRRRIWLTVAGLFMAGLIFYLIDVTLDYPGGAFTFAALFLFGVGAVGLVIGSLSRTRAHLPRTQWDVARQVLYTLRDDVGRKGRVTGWLDLTGPQQQSKLLRTGRTRSGRPKYYYRDPWFSAKIQLVLNRSNAKARLDDKEIEKSLKMKIAATVPSDGLVPASVNEGRPVVESAPKSKVAKGFESVYKLVAGEKSESSRASKRRWI